MGYGLWIMDYGLWVMDSLHPPAFAVKYFDFFNSNLH
jgi:hypothetical protein